MSKDEGGPSDRRSHVRESIPGPETNPTSDEPVLADVKTEYAAAWKQFDGMGFERTKAWAARTRLSFDRFETPAMQRRKRRLLGVTALSLATGWVGLIPKQIPLLQITIDKTGEVTFLALLLIAQVFSFFSYAVELREFKARQTLLIAEQRGEGVYQPVDNRVTRYLEALEREVFGWYRLAPQWATYAACAGLLYGILSRVLSR